LPAGLVLKLFFCGKFTINQKHSSHLWSSTQSSLLTAAGPLGAFRGENTEFLSMCSTKNNTPDAPEDNRVATKQRFLWWWRGLCMPACEVSNVQPSPLPKNITQKLSPKLTAHLHLQNPSLWLSFTSKSAVTQNRQNFPPASLVHLLEARNLLCKTGLFAAEIWGWADACVRVRGTNAVLPNAAGP